MWYQIETLDDGLVNGLMISPSAMGQYDHWETTGHQTQTTRNQRIILEVQLTYHRIHLFGLIKAIIINQPATVSSCTTQLGPYFHHIEPTQTNQTKLELHTQVS